MTITLKIAKVDTDSQPIDPTSISKINAYLAAVAKVVNSQIISYDTDLLVTFTVNNLGIYNANGGAYVGTVPGTTKLVSEVESKMIRGISLNSSDQVMNKSDLKISITPAVLSAINTSLSSASSEVDVNSSTFKLMLHEFGHALGFTSVRNPTTGEIYSPDTASAFDGKVEIISGSPFFIGKTAVAAYGGKVPLFKLGLESTSISHFSIESTNGIPSKFNATELMTSFADIGAVNIPVYSDMDLAVFRDIGYKIKNTITSLDKHTFIPGVETTKITGDAVLADTVLLDGGRSGFSLSHVGKDVVVTSKVTQPLTLTGIDTVQFDDYTVNLNIGPDSKLIPTEQLNKLVQLYIAFFNRVPDAAGLDYWVNRAHDGMTMSNIADSFFVNAQAQSAITGYSANATSRELVLNVYKNVLNRTSSTVPADEAGVQYWVHDLDSGVQTKSSLINSMIVAGYADPNTAKVLDNKLFIGKYFAVDQGLGYAGYDSTADAKAVAIAGAVTANDYTAALKLIGVTDPGFATQIA